VGDRLGLAVGLAVGLSVGDRLWLLDVGVSLGVDVVGDTDGLAEGLSLGVEVVRTEVVGVIVDPLIQFAALGGAQLAYVPWQHSSLLAK
jgi:hypothetical protein